MTDTALTAVIHTHGGPEVLTLEDRPVGNPGPGQIRIRHHAIGLNFIDCYQRSGLYPMQLPAALGMEAAGVVEAVGDGVTHLKPGDRAAYAAGHAALAEVLETQRAQASVRRDLLEAQVAAALALVRAEGFADSAHPFTAALLSPE